MTRVPSVDAFVKLMFQGNDRRVFAILDGALIDGLPQQLARSGLEYDCLFPGELDPELAEVMPYLVQLEANAPLLRQALSKGWREHWGMFGTVPSEVTFQDLRRHFRPILNVQGPLGQFMFFRYYDPRVLRHTVEQLDGVQFNDFLGPAEQLWASINDGTQIAQYQRGERDRCVVRDYSAGG